METKDKNSYKEYETESTSESSYLEVKGEIPKFEKTSITSSSSQKEELYSINKPRIKTIRAKIIND
ncbi:MAG: hypothetical protein MPEBLZ_02888 [Candidatus Methanoperedens nitroreducens]|uniref:Uncharacterized protein n=1 Tax=Candidatus Methanoperedens nitratireducens TaxID=1392998 RepID=A0A0P8CIA3_9EURY|nr:hypothetical protein [Candidatus Methanoperedens sp. BLZ2]KAB2945777.1 MAG: hypothetical protein F9K14_09905 [Candidatus Methanoperedens sp.]KPQ42542.1 MAG: hypothetical protein MPEBLZ_02888 [Candidatus Methanoperedens sp. BLZ1]MBZ0174265.1 hypothetical protein [Candidatus Methanoperedens nitroreducens]CAG0986965.1 hypothetical protein METP2_02333 [Methanosarcinales archaeon]MCX9077316.1 hypothetical protein [Candidatus Methanoperedens sp.]